MARCNCALDFDLELATGVQQMLFPKSLPVCSWCCIGVKNRMAQGLGGDYFDFISMPDGCQAIFIGDVTGHGLHASVIMALLYGFIHRSTREYCDPVQIVRETNDFLQSFATRTRELDHFFSSTLFWGIIDPRTLEMQFANAGHPPPLVLRDGTLHRLCPTAPPVGYFDHPEIGLGTFRFARNDRLLLYTDGIVDAVNPDGANFSLTRLQQSLLTRDGDYLEFLDRLFMDLESFESDTAPVDDCTAIVIDFHPFPV